MTTALVLNKSYEYTRRMRGAEHWDSVFPRFPNGGELSEETDKSLFERCPRCGDTQRVTVEDMHSKRFVVYPRPHWNVRRRRLNTCYVEHESNFVECCWDCYMELYDEYDEKWSDYYSSR